ncbi:histidine phosphatase family protein [Microbacterium foliorum]|uniref:Histidine phosphatase family protein n=1 Tax=Rothia terrae TaxID=396015 RepID=A0A7H2BEE6_9MICC|nr:histidine phosphatase family protein [Rothia terrae]MDT0189431.1 histidine phosphatase family protein [Rothia terrae]QNV38042.1 histidine phosphatase family protein [Rothia terrae]
MSETFASTPRHDAKKLIIMRHAEADWGLDDFNRPLTKHGHAQAPQVGRWLADNGHIPEMIISSAALRTRQTTTWVSEGLGEKAPTASLSKELYNAPASRIISAINGAPESVRSLMIVAHLPGVQDASLQLARPDSDYEALMDASYGFAPASVAVFDVLDDWAALDTADALLKAFKAF